ncbi:S9 family peptidase [Polymorphobacter megasporae]|nr:S9 family peptidase [Polymorphobacter megasporae]UAJ12096.1 S9 family peptidase [Polymorphobacter megasporae]
MRLTLTAVLLFTAAFPALPLAAQTPLATAASPVFTPRDVFGLEQATDVQISPDGKHIAYVRSSEDIMTDKARRTIWLVDVATGAQSPLLDGVASRPRWSPDGTKIAYAAADAGGKPQLYVHWMNSGTNARITALPDAPEDMAWSPDGKRIAFTLFTPDEGEKIGTPLAKPEGAKWADPLNIVTKVNYRADGEGYLKPGFTHVFVVGSDGGAPRQLTFGKYDDDAGLSWTRDGDAILFSSNHGKDWEREPLNSDIFAVAVERGTITQLTTRNGPDTAPQASPDGKLIAYTGFDDHLRAYENSQLSVMNRDGSGSRVISASLDRSVHSPRWSADGRSIVAAYEDHGVTKVARFDLDGRMTPVAEGLAGGDLDRPYTGGSFSVAKTGAVAFTAGTPAHPADVGLASGGKTRLLTRLNDGLFAGKTLGEVKAHHVASSADGMMIDYWMVTPPNYDPAFKMPLILEIHGGPYAAYSPVWSTEDQLYAAAGYVVVYANPRGSTSQGAAFANTIWKDYPSHDYDDLMSVVDDAIAHGPVDPNNLFVTGGSGGGLLTAWVVGKTNRFKAAVSQKPVINWASEGLTTDGYAEMLKYWFGAQPWENPDLLWKHSPLSLVGNVTTPTLLMVGEEDHRTPGSEAEQFYDALQIRKIPTALVRVPGASHHGLAERPSQLAAENGVILAWFGRYRTGTPVNATMPASSSK